MHLFAQSEVFWLATTCFEASLAIFIETPAWAAVGAVQGLANRTTVESFLDGLCGRFTTDAT